jgi:hypothetical protein
MPRLGVAPRPNQHGPAASSSGDASAGANATPGGLYRRANDSAAVWLIAIPPLEMQQANDRRGWGRNPRDASSEAAPDGSGNHIVDASGKPIVLRGADVSGTEFVCAQNYTEPLIMAPRS